MKIYVMGLTVLAIFLVLITMDYIWLGILTKKFLISQFGSLVKVKDGNLQINLLVGLITWFVIALGCFIFAVYPAPTLVKAMILGATFGFISYAIYDLTNLTFIVNYPVKFVFVDIAWGTFLCSTISVVGFIVKNLLK